MTSKLYVNQIVKKVKCSRKKRDEIRRQLLADVEMEMEQGESLERVMLRMGEPISIAEEFNQNLPEKERKMYKRGLAAKIIGIIAAMIAVLAAAALWYLPIGMEIGSSGKFDSIIIEERSKEIIRLLDVEDFDTIIDNSDEQMRRILNKEVIDSARRLAGEDWGNFKEFGKCYMMEQKQRGKVYALVQINAAYENIGITYTLLFNENMELAGLYIK